MENLRYFLFFCLLIFSAVEVHVVGRRGRSAKKLFVFGDSYADTGNWPKPSASSWKEPYGLTFPGKPSGRFSDGRVLTDYIASYMGIRSPLPYKSRKVGEKFIRYGMNFAHGGTGVFKTLVNEPNMTSQIDFFQQLIEDKVYTKRDLNFSIALVSVGGNDYATYMALNGTLEGLPGFTKSIINQLALNLKRIHLLGVRKISITTMEPLGCLPQFTVSSAYKNCSASENSVAEFHNQVLEQTLQKLNNESGEFPFQTLDLYKGFMSVLQRDENSSGGSYFKTPLKPCCGGVTRGYTCGSVDEWGKKKYDVCNDPNLSFFWDAIHPSQQGWLAVYSALRPSLHRLFF